MAQKDVILLTHVRHFIGPAASVRLLKEDAILVCHDMSFADAGMRQAFEAEMPDAMTVKATAPDEVIAEIMARFGRLDAVISNDPFPAERAPIDEADPEDLRRALEALTIWPFTLLGQAAKVMKAQQSGRIVLVTSAAPLTGIPNYTIYATARGAMNACVKSLSRELAKWNIPVNAIAPNYIKNPDYFPPELLANQDAMAKMLKNIPLGRLGEPQEVAELAALFASGRCGFVTGQVIPIAGGWA